MMPIPVWVLLGFAAWTLLTLFMTIGVYRWTRILTGRASIAEWRADEVQGTEWYRRALRAHMNCVENLPVTQQRLWSFWLYTLTNRFSMRWRLRFCWPESARHRSPFVRTDKSGRRHSVCVFFRADGLHDRNGRYRCRRGRFIIPSLAFLESGHALPHESRGLAACQPDPPVETRTSLSD